MAQLYFHNKLLSSRNCCHRTFPNNFQTISNFLFSSCFLKKKSINFAAHSYPDVEVSVHVTGANAEGVVGSRGDAGGLNLEDVGRH